MRCNHESCTCLVNSGHSHCSPECAEGVGVEPYCACGHVECERSPVGTRPLNDPLD